MENKSLKTTLTLKLTIVTDTGDLSVDNRIRNFVSGMGCYEPSDDCHYEVIADQCGDSTVIRHKGMDGKSFTFRDIDCFFERVFKLNPQCFMITLQDIAHLESVTSDTKETVETEKENGND